MTDQDPEVSTDGERYQRHVSVRYPLQSGRLVLRTEDDWDLDLEPASTTSEERFEFDLSSSKPWLEFKPVLLEDEKVHWAAGMNKLVALTASTPRVVYPHFDEEKGGTITDVVKRHCDSLGRPLLMRIYLPASYEENTFKHYPVLYMQDGANVFLPEEAFLGRDWEMRRTVEILDIMNLIHQTIIVAIYAGDRMEEYTKPGYDAYGRALTTEVKPWIDQNYRTLPGPNNTSVMGSSLGGVVSFYQAWEWPEVFGKAACLSSTFGHKDDLLERVRKDDMGPRRDLVIYLDSGWPGDNYEATFAMAATLVERGFVLGQNVHHCAFPLAQHDEISWGARAHLPLQLFAGRLRRLQRRIGESRDGE